MRWKKPCFVAVSIAGLAWVFGVFTTGFVLAMAAALIGDCYLPIAWKLRAPILAGLAIGLALLRVESFATGIPDQRLAGARHHVHVPHDSLHV